MLRRHLKRRSSRFVQSFLAYRLAFIMCLVVGSRGQCSVTTSHWGSRSSRVSI